MEPQIHPHASKSKPLVLAALMGLAAPLGFAAPATATPSETTGTGIHGKVTDGKTGEALIEATVKVVGGGPERSVLTDVDGNYELELPPGTYDLRVYYDVYQPRRIGNVVVSEDKETVLDVQLLTDQQAVEEVVVEAKADKRSEAALLAERKKAATVSDALSAQEIARSPDNNASDAVKRVVAATVIDSKYVFVRGLGGRYSTTLLNGADLPSPDPDEQAVPLDLFPTTLLANLTVFKTYNPDLPGAFSGGALQIETNSYPSKFELRLKLSAEYNSESTFRDLNTYQGGRLDWLGYDDGTRALPAEVPRDRPALLGTGGLGTADIEAIGESFPNIWSVRRRAALPNLGLSGSLGGTVNGKNGRRFGYLLAGNYSYRDRIQNATVKTLNIEGGELAVRESLSNVTGTQSVVSGALANFGFGLAPGHEINVFSTFTRNLDDRSIVVAGRSEPDREFIEGNRFQFVARTLSFTQVRGDHRFARARDFELRWQGNFSMAARSEPDTRDIEFGIAGNGQRRFRSEPQSGERFYSALRDFSGGGALHFTLPVSLLKVRWGGTYQTTSRTFSARRFRYVYVGEDASVLFQQPPERLFSAENIGPAFELQERTLQGDAYRGLFVVYGGYGMVDVQLGKLVRLTGGLRYEVATQRVTPGSPFSITQTPENGVDRTNGNFLPAVNVNLSLGERMNLRGGYSYTLARPRFRELAPFGFYDFTRRRALTGNPALRDTRIQNLDVRWELFPSEASVIAVSGYYKYFTDPIEQIIFDPASGDITWANQLAAHVIGAELELRTNLGFIASWLKGAYVAFNGSYIFSRVAIDPAKAGASTSSSRPLQGQSPFIVNANVGWRSDRSGTDLGLLYNVAGARIADVGFSGLPDIYEQPVHRLDFSFNQRLGSGLQFKVTATNLLNQSIRFRQGTITNYEFRPGVSVYSALEWTL